MKIVKTFLPKIVIFTAVKNLCMLHWCVFVMYKCIFHTHMYPNRFYGIIAVLVNDALSLLLKLLDDIIVPPLFQITIFVILPT